MLREPVLPDKQQRGVASPKAVPRSFTRSSLRNPEIHFRVLHFAQVPGTIKRSTESRAGTEQLIRSKKLPVPMILFAEYELPFAAGSYLLTGRFNPQRELEKHPTALRKTLRTHGRVKLCPTWRTCPSGQ